MDMVFCGHKGDVSGYFVSRCKAGLARLRKIAVEAADLSPERQRHFRLLAYVHLEETRGTRIFIGIGAELVNADEWQEFLGPLRAERSNDCSTMTMRIQVDPTHTHRSDL